MCSRVLSDVGVISPAADERAAKRRWVTGTSGQLNRHITHSVSCSSLALINPDGGQDSGASRCDCGIVDLERDLEAFIQFRSRAVPVVTHYEIAEIPEPGGPELIALLHLRSGQRRLKEGPPLPWRSGHDPQVSHGDS